MDGLIKLNQKLTLLSISDKRILRNSKQHPFFSRININKWISRPYPTLTSTYLPHYPILIYIKPPVGLAPNRKLKIGDHYCYNRIQSTQMEHELIQIRQTKKMGRGIFAKKDIPTGTNILTIEEDHFLTYTQVKQHRIFSRFQEDIESKIGCFAYYLAYCENLTQPIEDEIMTKEYVKELPEYFNNLICWDHDELQMLDNTPLKEKIRKIVGQYKLIYEKIVEALKNMIEKLRNPHIDQTESQQTAWESKRSTRSRPKKSIRHDSLISKTQAEALLQVTFRQFLRLIAAIKSRNIYWQHQYDFQSEVGALIPYLEFFNHSRNSQCSVNQRNGSEQVISTKPIRKGEEIFVKYGDNISVQQFLEDYGMIPYDQWKSEGKQNGRACDIYQINKLAKTVHEERVELAERYALIKEGQMGTVMEVKAPLCEKN